MMRPPTPTDGRNDPTRTETETERVDVTPTTTVPLCAPCGHSRTRRPEPLFRAPCTCRFRLPLLKATSQPPHNMATTPPGVHIRTLRHMRPPDPSASRLRRKTEDPALLPLSRRPHAAVNIYPFAHTWSLPLTTRPTHSRPAYLPTARNTANVPSTTSWPSHRKKRCRSSGWHCATTASKVGNLD